MTSDDLISMHKATDDVYRKTADLLDELGWVRSEPPTDTVAWVSPLSDLATSVQALAVVQRDMLAGLLA